MFTEVGKMKVLIFFVVLAFLAVALVVLVACLGAFEQEPSSGAEVLASGMVIVGKSGWASELRNNSNQINDQEGDPWDLQGLLESKVNAQFYSVGASDCSEAQYKDAVTQTLDQIDVMIRVFQKYDKYFKPALSSHDIFTARELYKIAGFLSVDGGYALDSRMSVLRDYYRLGVRSVALGGLCSTPWSTSSMDTANAGKNLTEFGKLIIKEMNRLGILIDLTGSNEAIQRETIELSEAPVIFSSSSSSALTPNAMNVDDDVIQALCEKEGLIMISLRANQICNDSTDCSVDQVIEHLDHIAAFGTGKNCVGIGGDVSLSTVPYPKELTNSSGYVTLFQKLLDSGNWTVEELQKLEGRNFLRVMEKVEEVARTMQENQILPNESLLPTSDIPENEQACYSHFPQVTEIDPRKLEAFVSFQGSVRSFKEKIGETTLAPTTPSPSGETMPAPTTPSSSGETTPAPTTPSSSGETTPAPTTPSSSGETTPAPANPSSIGETTPAPTTPSSSGETTPAPTTASSSGETTPAPTTPSSSGETTPAPATPSSSGVITLAPSSTPTNSHQTKIQVAHVLSVLLPIFTISRNLMVS